MSEAEIGSKYEGFHLKPDEIESAISSYANRSHQAWTKEIGQAQGAFTLDNYRNIASAGGPFALKVTERARQSGSIDGAQVISQHLLHIGISMARLLTRKFPQEFIDYAEVVEKVLFVGINLASDSSVSDPFQRTQTSINDEFTREIQARSNFTNITDRIADPDQDLWESVLVLINRASIDEALRHLQPREQSILRDRYGLDGPPKTLEEIASTQDVGKTRQTIHRVEKSAIWKLRRANFRRKLIDTTVEEEATDPQIMKYTMILNSAINHLHAGRLEQAFEDVHKSLTLFQDSFKLASARMGNFIDKARNSSVPDGESEIVDYLRNLYFVQRLLVLQKREESE